MAYDRTLFKKMTEAMMALEEPVVLDLVGIACQVATEHYKKQRELLSEALAHLDAGPLGSVQYRASEGIRAAIKKELGHGC